MTLKNLDGKWRTDPLLFANFTCVYLPNGLDFDKKSLIRFVTESLRKNTGLHKSIGFVSSIII